MAAVVCGALAFVPQSASAQGLWVGGWGWGGPIAVGGFGPAFGPGLYGFGPRYVAPFSPFAWGYPAYRTSFYGPAVVAPPVYAAPVVAPVYAPVYRPAPVYVGPSAHAVRVGGRVARRSWRRGFGWGW